MKRTKPIPASEVTEYFCDEPGCGKPSKEQCDICKCDLCICHRAWDYENSYYCYSCWATGEPFRQKIFDLRMVFDAATDEQLRLWKEAALKAKEAKP